MASPSFKMKVIRSITATDYARFLFRDEGFNSTNKIVTKTKLSQYRNDKTMI